MISNNYIPEKINEYNAYLDGTKMIGVAASVSIAAPVRPLKTVRYSLPFRMRP